MQWWAALHQGVGVFFREHGLLAAFVLLLVEEAGVPSPIPGDLFMLALGVRARTAGALALGGLAAARAGGGPSLPAIAGAEAVRHLAYGALLGATYPVLLARRLPRPRHAAGHNSVPGRISGGAPETAAPPAGA